MMPTAHILEDLRSSDDQLFRRGVSQRIIRLPAHIAAQDASEILDALATGISLRLHDPQMVKLFVDVAMNVLIKASEVEFSRADSDVFMYDLIQVQRLFLSDAFKRAVFDTWKRPYLNPKSYVCHAFLVWFVRYEMLDSWMRASRGPMAWAGSRTSDPMSSVDVHASVWGPDQSVTVAMGLVHTLKVVNTVESFDKLWSSLTMSVFMMPELRSLCPTPRVVEILMTLLHSDDSLKVVCGIEMSILLTSMPQDLEHMLKARLSDLADHNGCGDTAERLACKLTKCGVYCSQVLNRRLCGSDPLGNLGLIEAFMGDEEAKKLMLNMGLRRIAERQLARGGPVDNFRLEFVCTSLAYSSS